MSSEILQILIVIILSGIVFIISLIYWLFFNTKEETNKIQIANQLDNVGNSFYFHQNSIIANGSRSQYVIKIESQYNVNPKYSDSKDNGNGDINNSDKLLREQFYEAQCINTQPIYINYITNPYPSYEEIAQDLKLQRPTLVSPPTYQFDMKGVESNETGVVIVPSTPSGNNNPIKN